ncbi:SprT family protein [Tuberibacillus sp. Marseille-P3662]|uniref:SprT family protein n=1 Tax=Tuberibacillus sp. Marseille-P3662 TaxID=1965358 RepID=UPI000A1CCA7C|nr:SprT family protein [Tuberibacillus sp. Marseille-P3662]
MTDDELQQLVESVSIESFNTPFKHKATFNNRLKTTGGRYLLKNHHIEFNPKQLQYFGKTEFIKIIKHELCHYHLHLRGDGYRHRDLAFKRLLNKVGGSRYCRLVPGTKKSNKKTVVYQCQSCYRIYHKRREMDPKKYACGQCKGRIKKIKTIVDDA